MQSRIGVRCARKSLSQKGSMIGSQGKYDGFPQFPIPQVIALKKSSNGIDEDMIVEVFRARDKISMHSQLEQ